MNKETLTKGYAIQEKLAELINNFAGERNDLTLIFKGEVEVEK